MWIYRRIKARIERRLVESLRQRRGVVHISLEFIEDMLGLPDNCHVVRIHAEPMSDSIAVVVSAPTLPIIPEGEVVPVLQSTMYYDDDNRLRCTIMLPV